VGWHIDRAPHQARVGIRPTAPHTPSYFHVGERPT